ncbi:MAG: serine/threonine-protein kinase [Sandaracinaceae bacterium]
MLRKLEKYEIQEEIGHGGMATVYRARDSVLDRNVALKVMHPHLRGAEEARRRFHREAQSVARLRHPKVMEIYDFSGEGSEEAYIAAELLTGPTLKRWREDAGQVPAEVAACVVIEVCRALAAAHEAGIVHRDVKPENVLLHEDRTLKLTDFGIADMMDAHSMTATGQILGSPGHMAPEQIEGKPTDPRTDLFSLGTVLYYLSTGRLPFTGRNPHQILKRIMDGEYADPLRVNPTLGGELRGIIVKSLERDPDARFQTADELRETLEAFVAKVGIDDPEALLGRYLVDPKKVGDEVRADVVEALTRQGKAASDESNVPLALDCYNRVLAIDDGNERVLRLIEQVGVDRRRRAAFLLGGVLLAIGATSGAAAWAFWPDSRDGDGDPVLTALDAGTRDASVPDAEATLDSGPLDAADADLADAAQAAAGPDAAPPDAFVAVRRPRRDAGRRGRPNPVARVRTVIFTGDHSSVKIGVDGSQPRSVVNFRTTELTVGPHQLRLVPEGQARTSYRESTVRIVVPPGTGEHPIPIQMEFQPGSLFVSTNVPATVTVGRARGPANDMLSVPMQRIQQAFPVRVSAPGYEQAGAPPTVRLDAGGGTREVRIELVPAPE